MIGVAVLGSTGSVGESTLDVLARNPERFRLVALAANTNAAKLARQVLAFRPPYAALADATAAAELTRLLGTQAPGTRVLGGAGALEDLARLPEVQCVMAAIVGAAGLRSTLAAAQAGKRLLLANKESLVMSGDLLLADRRQEGVVAHQPPATRVLTSAARRKVVALADAAPPATAGRIVNVEFSPTGASRPPAKRMSSSST